MSPLNLAVIGECMIELSGQPFKAMQQNFGGDIINTAIYLKKLAGDRINVYFVSSVGKDALSNALVAKWQEYGITTDHVLANSDKRLGLYMIQNDDDGERVFHYWRNDSAARYLMQHKDINQVFDQLAQCDAVYLSGISLAILPEADCEALLAKLVKLHDTGVKIIYDSNYRPALWQQTGKEVGLTAEQSLARAKEVNQQIFAITDLALITLDDEQALWHDASLDACRTRIAKYGIKEIVLKDGANGCQYCVNDQQSNYPTTKIDTVVDTTAAGDSFNAGFICYWLQQQKIVSCATAGNLTAGQVIQQKGAIVELDSNRIIDSVNALTET
jgi:2-dehydro-3-deoxygluconokinase